MSSLQTPGLVLTFVLGVSAGGASCMLPSTHCAYNIEIECEANEVCSRCEQGDGCGLISVVDPRCYAYPEEEESTTTGEDEAEETTETGDVDTSESDAGSSTSSAGSSTSMTSSSASETADPTLPGLNCGNGVIEDDEECDDGNLEDDDYCVSGCKLASCGDGFVSPLEECDDKNLSNDDGCNNECARDRVMFVSSTWHNGILDGIDGAINICRGLALAADLTGDFYPWLSDAEKSPSTFFFRSRGRYVLTDMVTVIADDWDDLTDGTLQNPPAMDENGVWLVDGQVWTATLTDGEPNPLLQHCSGWSTTEGPGRIGFMGQTDYSWTVPDGTPIPCGNGARIYCIEQE